MTENQIQAEIIKEFGTRPDCRVFRMNTGAVKHKNRYVAFGIPGQPDIFLFANKLFAGIEVKTATGIQSVKQKNYQRMLEKYGHKYILARSVQDVRDALECECGVIGEHCCDIVNRQAADYTW